MSVEAFLTRLVEALEQAGIPGQPRSLCRGGQAFGSRLVAKTKNEGLTPGTEQSPVLPVAVRKR
jgi:hypothetical protein